MISAIGDKNRRPRSTDGQSVRLKVDAKPTTKLRERVEEFRLLSNNEALREVEYDKRRGEWTRRGELLKLDKPLQRWKKCYIPSVLSVVGGAFLLFVCSIKGLSGDSVFFHQKIVFQVIGGVLVGVGVVLIMVTAACTYKREEFIGTKSGFPKPYTSTKSYKRSTSLPTEFMRTQNDADIEDIITRKTNGCQNLRSHTSAESGYFGSPVESLGESFSSTRSARQWIHTHGPMFPAGSGTIRRQSSDTVLDKSFARARLLAWEEFYKSGSHVVARRTPEWSAGMCVHGAYCNSECKPLKHDVKCDKLHIREAPKLYPQGT
ncbi:unnamed protein product [Lymnaea stagnalis]|uniref:Uncharacterized protein n=1 Tax=Lymnaea stagnalis TaxID=6523 RepID=A0AAV2HPH3_LYMST